MENKSLDNALKEALAPSVQAKETLDQAILEKLQVSSGEGRNGDNLKIVGGRNSKIGGNSGKWNVRSALPKAAAIVLAIAVAGAGTVYAAGKLLDKAVVTTHGISVGNEEYIDDDALAQPWESVEVENKGEESPGPDDKWSRKRSVLASGRYLSEYYYYDKYFDAIEDTRFESLFREIPGVEQSVCYSTTDLLDDTMEYAIDAIFEYESGIISTYQSVMEGNVASDAAYGIVMKQTGNVRTYVSKSGMEFSLVDDLAAEEGGLTTIVMISYDNIRGYVGFRGLTEEQIQQVLDMVDL